jgi:hypothetical protein
MKACIVGAIAFVSAISSAAHAEELILPGQLDLPVISGTSLMESCKGWFSERSIDPPTGQCVAAGTIAHVMEPVIAYKRALMDRGWNEMPGSVFVLGFKRARGDGCWNVFHLAVVNDELTYRAEQTAPSSQAILLFKPGDILCPGLVSK